MQGPGSTPGGTSGAGLVVGGGSFSPSALTTARRVSIARLVNARGGAVSVTVLAKELDIPMGSISAAVDCPYFEPTATGYALTVAGRKELIGGK